MGKSNFVFAYCTRCLPATAILCVWASAPNIVSRFLSVDQKVGTAGPWETASFFLVERTPAKLVSSSWNSPFYMAGRWTGRVGDSFGFITGDVMATAGWPLIDCPSQRVWVQISEGVANLPARVCLLHN